MCELWALMMKERESSWCSSGLNSKKSVIFRQPKSRERSTSTRCLRPTTQGMNDLVPVMYDLQIGSAV